jgi:hypothetical protein
MSPFQICSLLWEGFDCEALGSWHRKIGQTISWSYAYTVAVPGMHIRPYLKGVCGLSIFGTDVCVYILLQLNLGKLC